MTVALPAVATVLGPGAEPQPVFHSLFSDAQRQPVPQLVQDLWTSNPRVAAALTGVGGPPTAATDAPASAPQASPASAMNTPMNLFSDRPADVRAVFGERT